MITKIRQRIDLLIVGLNDCIWHIFGIDLHVLILSLRVTCANVYSILSDTVIPDLILYFHVYISILPYIGAVNKPAT